MESFKDCLCRSPLMVGVSFWLVKKIITGILNILQHPIVLSPSGGKSNYKWLAIHLFLCLHTVLSALGSHLLGRRWVEDFFIHSLFHLSPKRKGGVDRLLCSFEALLLDSWGRDIATPILSLSEELRLEQLWLALSQFCLHEMLSCAMGSQPRAGGFPEN